MAQGIHPDVITVVDADHKQISVDTIRQMRSDAFIRPNEGVRKVYLFPDASLLTDQDQNVLLKLVEEGPGYAAFVFCTQNPASMLQTMRSRCIELHVEGNLSASNVVGLEDAQTLCGTLLKKKGALTAWAVTLEKQKCTRQELEKMLACSYDICVQALLVQQGHQITQLSTVNTLAQSLSKGRLAHTIDILQRYYLQCAYNVGVGHTLGALAIELEELT